MTTQRSSETGRKSEGMDAILEAGFTWLEENARLVVGSLVGILILGGVVAGLYEWDTGREEDSQTALDQIERRFLQAMGSEPGQIEVTEPANQDQARRSREKTLAELEALIAESAGSFAARTAGIRAAEMEVDLGRFEPAAERLAELAAGAGGADPLRSIALRLRGYALEELGRPAEAGAAYADAGRVETYPDRAGVWLLAGMTLVRAGDLDAALEAYQEVLRIDPGLAEREGVLDRLAALEARSPAP